MKFGPAFACAMLCIAGQATVMPVPVRPVKAAYLVRFPQFVTWPAEAVGTPLSLCLSPSHEFGSAVAAAAADVVVRGRSLAVRTLTPADPGENCDLLYVAVRDEHLLLTTRRRPVLTVGDDAGFCQRGGVINFRIVDDRLRFEVSLTHAAAAGLAVDPQLLRLALAVHGGRQ